MAESPANAIIELQRFDEADIPTLIEWAVSEAFLMQWVGPTFRYPLDREQLETHFELTRGDAPSVLAFKAVTPEDGRMVGYLEICGVDRDNRSATLGRVIVSEESRGLGIGGAMVSEAVRIGFESLDLHRIGLVVFDFNTAGVRCYKKAGFRIDGRLRDARRMGDEYWTLCVMSVLEDEWRSSRAIG